MAKSARRRKHAARIYKNWVRKCKTAQCTYKLNSLSFGKVYKQDPWDCGNPQCGMCCGWKVEEKVKRRKALREDEKQGIKDLD